MPTNHLHQLLYNLQLRKIVSEGHYDERNLAYRPGLSRTMTFQKVFKKEISLKLELIGPDAVYHFKNEPFILFFDLSINGEEKYIEFYGENRNKEKIFKQCWCLDRSPIIFIITEQDYELYNAFNYQKRLDKGYLERININKPEIERLFNFWELESGNTWKWIEERLYKRGISEKRVNQVLFKNIRFASDELTNSGLKNEFANLLILRLIFCRYLIDRGVEFNSRYLKGNKPEDLRHKLNELITDRVKLLDLFQYLKRRFNGNLFVTDEDPKIKQSHLNLLSKIFSGDVIQNQPFLFDVFDFSIIPVEIISSIYESIIHPEQREKNSAVYTPNFLVEYILKNTIEERLSNSRKINCKVLDPACGSGIFLVQAYRQMVEKAIDLKKGKVPDDETLKLIATQNIFGIDKDINALNVAAFSIYIALLDYKDPKTLKSFEFPYLLYNPNSPKESGDNLYEADFFDESAPFNYVRIFTEKRFAFIIGNPPWKSNKDEFHLLYIRKNKLPITDFQIAQTFLLRTRDFASNTTVCSFIVTSSIFHNADKFKDHLLKNCVIESLVDFSPARRLVFEKSSNPCLIIKVRNVQPPPKFDNLILHISPLFEAFRRALRTINKAVSHAIRMSSSLLFVFWK